LFLPSRVTRLRQTSPASWRIWARHAQMVARGGQSCNPVALKPN
jgi:hypothetical protein